MDGIRLERQLLEEIKGRAHQIIDTSQLKPAQLKEKIVNRFHQTDQNRLSVTFQSFGFKYGVPIDADLVFDVRFLPNPHYVDSLKPRTGTDQDVRSEEHTSELQSRFDRVCRLLLEHKSATR